MKPIALLTIAAEQNEKSTYIAMNLLLPEGVELEKRYRNRKEIPKASKSLTAAILDEIRYSVSVIPPNTVSKLLVTTSWSAFANDWNDGTMKREMNKNTPSDIYRPDCADAYKALVKELGKKEITMQCSDSYTLILKRLEKSVRNALRKGAPPRRTSHAENQ